MTLAPTRIKIGPHIYEVCWSDRVAEAETQCLGCCLVTDQVVRLPSTRKKQQIVSALFHEIFHALYATLDLSEEDKQEHVVTTFGLGFTAVWVDNPSLILWIQEMLSDPEGKLGETS